MRLNFRAIKLFLAFRRITHICHHTQSHLPSILDALANPDTDEHGKALEASRRPSRAGKPRKADSDYDF